MDQKFRYISHVVIPCLCTLHVNCQLADSTFFPCSKTSNELLIQLDVKINFHLQNLI